MAEVGVLSLQIHDNSEKAASGLNKLASALERVRGAVTGVKSLGSIGRQIESINTAVRNASTGGTIENLNGIASALKRVREAADGIDLSKIKFSVSSGRGGKLDIGAEAKRAAAEASGAFENMGNQIEEDNRVLEEMNALIQNVSWTAGEAEKKFERMFDAMNKARMSRSLGGGSAAGYLGSGPSSETGWQWYNPWGGASETGWEEWKNGAIEAEYTVSDAMEETTARITDGMALIVQAQESAMDAYAGTSEAVDDIDRAFEETISRAEQMAEGIANASENIAQVQAVDSMTDGFVDMASAIEETNEALEEERERLREVRAEAQRAQDRAYLENNYAQFRELYMSGESPWTTQVPERYGISGDIIEQCETYADAMRMAAEEAERIQSAIEATASAFRGIVDTPRLGSGQAPLLLGDGGVAPENALSTWVDTSAQWKPDWTGGENYKPDWVFAEGTVSEAQAVTDSAETAAEAVQTAAETIGNSMRDASDQTTEATGRIRYGMEDATMAATVFKNALIGSETNFKSFGDAVKGLFPHLSMLGKQLMSIARRMALRAVIKQVTAGIKEGVENLYWYSKAVGTDFAPAMDSAASAMLQFKNSIGAAAAPVIQALIPVLQTVVNWFITAINYANQFLALITGKSGWTRALPVAADAFEQTGRRARSAGSSAREAAKDVKELLADWDELNIIQSETGGGTGSGGGGGGGAGGTTAEYASMFQEMSRFNEDIQAFVRNLTNSFGSILELVKKVGVAMLAWKVSSTFGGIVGTLAGLIGTAVALDLVVRLTGAFDNTFLDTGHEGWLIGSLLTPIIGGVFTQQILSHVLKGNIAKLSIPIMLTVSSIVDIVTLAGRTDVSALDKKSIEESVVSALKAGGAAAYFAYVLGKATLGTALLSGTAVAIATFGVAIGIKAIAQAAKDGPTMEDIKAAALASLAVGIGAGMFAKIAGASMVGAAAFGGAAAAITVATLAVGIGIAAAIASKPEAVKWGDYDATEEEIKNFVEGSVFKVNANTILNMINPKIEAVSTEEEGLTAKADEVKLTVSKVLLGFDDKETLKDLEKQILGTGEGDDSESLIGKLRKTMKAKNSVIETGIILQFSNPGDGSTEASKEAKNQLGIVSAGWEAIDNEISSLGRSLSASFGRAYREGITEEAKAAEIKTIAELSQMIANVSAAMVRGEAEAQAQINLKENLSGLSRDSFGNILDYIKEYKEEVSNAYTTAYDAVIKELGSQAAALKQSWDNELELAENAKTESERAEHERNAKAYEEQYKKTHDLYQSKLDGRDEAISDMLGKAINNDTLVEIRNAILGNLQGKAGLDNISAAFSDAMYAAFHDADATTEQKSGAVTDLLNNMIDQYFGKDADTIKGLIKEGILNYKDVVDQGVVEALAGGGIWDSEQDVWQTIIDQIFGAGEPVEAEPTGVTLPMEVQPEIEEAVSEASTTEEILGGLATEAEGNLNATDSIITNHTFPVTNTVDTSATTGATGDMAAQVHSDVMSVASDINWLNSMVGGYGYSGIGGAGRFSGVTGVKVYSRATGGNIRSGELFFGNENGNIEMMGKMGNSAVVANNQQIVEGISKGVAASNSGMESAMNMMVTLMRQFLGKEFTAKVVPSSSMGRNNAMSNEAYRKVTG